jgi:hypothetical protein
MTSRSEETAGGRPLPVEIYSVQNKRANAAHFLLTDRRSVAGAAAYAAAGTGSFQQQVQQRVCYQRSPG